MNNKERIPEFTVEFLPVGQGKKQKRGITTIAILTVSETGKVYKGLAHCNPTDVFNKEIGQKIAEARARKQYFKAQANEAIAQHRVAQSILETTKKYADKKQARYEREAKWLTNYVTII